MLASVEQTVEVGKEAGPVGGRPDDGRWVRGGSNPLSRSGLRLYPSGTDTHGHNCSLSTCILPLVGPGNFIFGSTSSQLEATSRFPSKRHELTAQVFGG